VGSSPGGYDGDHNGGQQTERVPFPRSAYTSPMTVKMERAPFRHGR